MESIINIFIISIILFVIGKVVWQRYLMWRHKKLLLRFVDELLDEIKNDKDKPLPINPKELKDRLNAEVKNKVNKLNTDIKKLVKDIEDIEIKNK